MDRCETQSAYQCLYENAVRDLNKQGTGEKLYIVTWKYRRHIFYRYFAYRDTALSVVSSVMTQYALDVCLEGPSPHNADNVFFELKKSPRLPK
jgi:hypothetical protein